MTTVVNPPRYTTSSQRRSALAERGRKVAFSGDTPNYEYFGHIEVMSGKDNVMSIHCERSQKKKYAPNARWHTESVYAEISREDWKHLISAPVFDEE